MEKERGRGKKSIFVSLKTAGTKYMAEIPMSMLPNSDDILLK